MIKGRDFKYTTEYGKLWVGKFSNGMRVITVSGAESGVGKTTVAERLLKNLKGWSALKITVLHRGPCPTMRECGACDDINADYSIVRDEKKLLEGGKDTERFKRAGAEKVLWLKSKPQGLKGGLKTSLEFFKGAKGLVIEGTSILKHFKPDLAIFVTKKNSVLKPSARDVLNKMDIIVEA